MKKNIQNVTNHITLLLYNGNILKNGTKMKEDLV